MTVLLYALVCLAAFGLAGWFVVWDVTRLAERELREQVRQARRVADDELAVSA